MEFGVCTPYRCAYSIYTDPNSISSVDVVSLIGRPHLDAFLPGILIVCVTPCRSRNTGETAVVGEELILPLSDLGERSPLTRTSQLPPPLTSEIQQQPV